jgi:lysophospholipase L1-like esterase
MPVVRQPVARIRLSQTRDSEEAMPIGRSMLLVVGVGFAVAATTLQAQVADPDPMRFDSVFTRFAAWDAQNAVPEDGILFVGSSSIVRWSTAESFPGLPVINRGFGGSQASDVLPWLEEAVLQYDPAVVVYYEGDNDASAGKKADQIFADIREFSEAVLAHDPATRVVILSVKPSPLRWAQWPEMQATNALIREYADSRPTVEYVDVGTPMLGADGQPMPHLYVQDRLHMTPAGYEIWNRVVGPVLDRLSDN